MTTTITVSQEMLVPLRSALYARLIEGADALDTALTSRGPESKLAARTAYQELRATGALLDRIGWQQEPQSTIEIDLIGEARLVIDALTTELETEAGSVGTARGFGEDHTALAHEQRWQAVHAALWQIEAATASPTTEKAGSSGDAKA